MHTRERIVRVLGAVLLVVMVAAGCAPAEPEMETVRIQMSWLTNSQHAGWLVADAKGYYADEGIDVEIVPGGPNLSAPQQVATGAVELGLCDYPEVIGAQNEGIPVISIAHVYHGTPRRIVAFNDSGIQTPADLEGRRVGLQFGGEEYEFMALMNQFGLDWQEDMTIVQQGFSLDLLITGDIDAGQAMTYNQLEDLYNRGYEEEDLTIIDLTDYGVAMASQVLIAEEDWLAEHEDLAARFVRASIRGWKDALQDIDMAVDTTMGYMEEGVTTVEEQTDTLQIIAEMVVLEGMSEDDILAIDEDDLINSCNIAAEFEMIEEPIDPQSTYTTAIWEQATGRETPDF